MTPENSSASPAPSFPRFETAPYQPDGGFSSGGSALMIAAAVVTGLVLGFLASMIRQWFYLVLLFPLGIGLAMGAVSIWAIKQGKIRSPMIAGVAGFFGGCTAMLAMHFFDYQRFLVAVEKEMPGARQVMEANGFGFWQFMDVQAEEGVKLSRARGGNKDKGLNLGYTGSIIYWSIEALIVAGIAFAMARSSAGEPFCRQCRNWKETRTFGGLSIGTHAASTALTDGNLSAFYQALQAPDLSSPTVVLQAAVCSGCVGSGAIDVKALEATQNDKGELQFNELVCVTYPGAALPVFEAVFASVPPDATTELDAESAAPAPSESGTEKA